MPVFRAIVLKEALNGWALLLLRAQFWAPQRDWYGLLVCHELLRVKGLGSKVAQLISNLIVP
jgi:hypothetical protein